MASPMFQKANVDAAIFSSLVYEAHQNSQIPGKTSHDRLERILHDPNVISQLGHGWSVLESNQDAALFINRDTGKLCMAIRGTSCFRDWVNNAFGALGIYDSRVQAVMNSKVGEKALEEAKSNNLDVIVTGHSLGGSVAQAIGAIMHFVHQCELTVVTFNAPNLPHKQGKYASEKEALENQGKLHRIEIEGDPVSKIDLDKNTTSTTVVPNPLWKIIWDHMLPDWKTREGIQARMKMLKEAHLMSTILQVLTRGEWGGTYSRDTLDSSIPTKDLGEPGGGRDGDSDGDGGSHGSQTDQDQMVFVLDENENELWIDELRKLEEEKGNDIKMTPETKRGFFFCLETKQLVVRQKDGTEVYRRELSSNTVLSKHSLAALNAIRNALKAQTLNWLTSAKGSRPKVALVLRQTTEAGALAFCGSVVGDKITPLVGDNEMLGGTLAAGAVAVGYNSLLGDHKAAIKGLYETAASTILQYATELPISAGRTDMFSSSSLFGGREATSFTKRDHVSMNNKGFSFGIHIDRTTEQWKNKAGQNVVRESHTLGSHVGTAGVDVSLGLKSGFEASNAVSFVDDQGVTRQLWFDRKFSGSLTLSLQIGQKCSSVSLFPAWSSHKRKYEYFFSEDGGDLPQHPARSGLDNKFLPPGEPSNGMNTQAAAGLLNQAAMPVGRTEHTTEKLVTHHTKKKFFGLQCRRWDQTDTYGWAKETGDALFTEGVDTSGNNVMQFNQMDTDSVLSSWHDQDGVRLADTVSHRVHDTVRISYRQDGKDLTPARKWEKTLRDSTTLYSEEHDRHLQERVHSEKDANGRDRMEATDTSHAGHGLHISRGPEVRDTSAGQGKYLTKKTDVVFRESYVDLLSEETVTTLRQRTDEEKAALQQEYDNKVAQIDKTCRQKPNSKPAKTLAAAAKKDALEELNRQLAEEVAVAETTQNKHNAGANRHAQGTRIDYDTEQLVEQLQPHGLFTKTTGEVTETHRQYEASSEPASATPENPTPAAEPSSASTATPASSDNDELGTPNKVYSDAPPIVKKIPFEITQGWFVDTTTPTEAAADGKAQKVLSRRLNQGADRSLGILITNGLDHAINLIQLYRAGKCDIKQVANAIGNLLIDMGEGYLVGLSGQLAALAKKLGDALGWALVTMVVAYILRMTLAWATRTKITEEEAKVQKRESDLKLANSGLSVEMIGALAAAARAGIQLCVVGYEMGFSSPIMFGISQIVTTFQKVALIYKKDGWSSINSLRKIAVFVGPEIGVTAGATLASVAVSKLGGKLLTGYLATWSGTLTASLAGVVVPALAFWAAMKLLTKLWESQQGTQDQRDLKQLKKKYGLPVDTDLKKLHRVVKRHSLTEHPDKGGTKERFHLLSKDLKRISELTLTEIHRKHSGKEPSGLMIKVAGVMSYLREMSSKWTQGSVPDGMGLEKELELLKFITQTDHYDPGEGKKER